MTAGERWAYLAEGNRRQARKRVAADVPIQDEHDRALPAQRHGHTERHHPPE